MRILVTNDDGIDSIGLHVLARAMATLGDVVVVAPDKEYSGYGAAFGPLHLIKPDVHRASIDGIDEVWSVTGPPALCVMFGRLDLFGHYDLVVAGINPGANVGRSIYHSGTVGACLTARNGGVSGVAVSQTVSVPSAWRARGWDEMLADQNWETAGAVAAAAVADWSRPCRSIPWCSTSTSPAAIWMTSRAGSGPRSASSRPARWPPRSLSPDPDTPTRSG